MARIRTIKPEAFFSESLAEVSVNAERTFFGLLTQADDQGRFRDNAAIINGLLWPLRAEHTAVHAEDDLQQLADAGLICRYTGCDGRRYLHAVTWREHQKIDKASQSRLPSCPVHHTVDRCGACKGVCAAASAEPGDVSPSPTRTLPEASPNSPEASIGLPTLPHRPLQRILTTVSSVATAGGTPRTKPSPTLPTAIVKRQVRRHSLRLPRTFPEASGSPRRLDLGSWILDLLILRGAQRPHHRHRREP
ncbi:hypothetical protein GCM10020295_37250 [Streptomyces cinereospinus]